MFYTKILYPEYPEYPEYIIINIIIIILFYGKSSSTQLTQSNPYIGQFYR